MPKKPIFNNKLVTKLLKKYVRHKKSRKQRDKIMLLTLPLIEAALSKQGMYRGKEDIRQECALKVLRAIPKYTSGRGDAFGFFWTVICNMSKTINKRLHKSNSSSLSTDENIQREAELSAKEIFQTPENQHILTSISEAVTKSIQSANVDGHHRKAMKCIRESMISGEFFFEKNLAMKKLRSIGLGKKEVLYYYQSSLVMVRSKLLEARANANALSHPKISKTISPISDSGDLQNLRS